MAKDDYHVIVYQILAYLYAQLKAGEDPDEAMLKPESTYIGINPKYWAYIMKSMVDQGFISGVVVGSWGGEAMLPDLSGIQITPAGIEYLCDNSFIEKAKRFLKDTKAIVPFI